MTDELIRVPDIGGAEGAEVVEVLVAPGEAIDVEQSLIVVESDKASMEIPAPRAGVVGELRVAVGDVVSEGDVILMIAAQGAVDGEGATAAEVRERRERRREGRGERRGECCGEGERHFPPKSQRQTALRRVTRLTRLTRQGESLRRTRLPVRLDRSTWSSRTSAVIRVRIS